MATKTRLKGFDFSQMRESMLNSVIEEQNRRLIEYAKEEIVFIGNKIYNYHSRNHMDRTGNLLNSLCWGVSYDGKLVSGGFYTSARYNTKGPGGTHESYLHEWSTGENGEDYGYMYPVHGRKLATEYIQRYGNNGTKGWRVFFAILAPYWGYWEKGFNMKRGGGVTYAGEKKYRIPQTTKFMQFAVMTQFYDDVKKDLKPARVRFRVSVPKYNSRKFERDYKKYYDG